LSFIKGAPIAIVELDEDGVRVNETVLDYLTERTMSFGMLYKAQKVYVTHWIMEDEGWDSPPGIPNESEEFVTGWPVDNFLSMPTYLSIWDMVADTWSTPELLGNQVTNRAGYGFAHTERHCLIHDSAAILLSLDGGTYFVKPT
jgi:hypothetical protein